MKYILIIGLMIMTYQANAQAEKFKSLFMYKFLQGMEWPDGKVGDKYVVAVLGDQKIIDNLQVVLKGRNVKGKMVEVKNYVPGTSLTGVSVLFIANSKKDLFESLQKEAVSSSTVLIMESPGFGSKGACMNFVNAQGKLKFEMNQKIFDEMNIKVAGNISSLAIKVE